jgi:hypothetical protein
MTSRGPGNWTGGERRSLVCFTVSEWLRKINRCPEVDTIWTGLAHPYVMSCIDYSLFRVTMSLTNQNDIHDEIKSRLNSGNVYYYKEKDIFCLPVSYQKY